jgi:hypothetical protein
VESATRCWHRLARELRRSSTASGPHGPDPFVAIGPDGFAEGRRGAEMVRYQVSQTIPFPGKRGARGAAASERTASAEADVATLERQLTVVATQAFYRLLHVQGALELNRELTDLVADAEARLCRPRSTSYAIAPSTRRSERWWPICRPPPFLVSLALLTLIVVPLLYLLYARRAVVGATSAGRETGAG